MYQVPASATVQSHAEHMRPANSLYFCLSYQTTQWYNVNSSLVLEVKSQSTANGATVDQWSFNGGPNQSWCVRGTFASGNVIRLTNYHSGRCLEVYGSATNNGAKVDQWSCNGTPTQEWVVRRVGTTKVPQWEFVNYHSGKCLDVTGRSTSSGAPLQQWTCLGGTNQLWYG
jgi:hypothetical protein